MKYCSQCKHSRYIKYNAKSPTILRCKLYKELGWIPSLSTDCTNAEYCPRFDPERWQDALTTRIQYDYKCILCGIKQSEKIAVCSPTYNCRSNDAN